MERSGSHAQLKQKETKKKEERKTNAHFLGGKTGRKERSELEREMRETLHSLYDLRKPGGRNPSNQDLKFIYSTRTTCGYRQHTVSPKISGLEKKI